MSSSCRAKLPRSSASSTRATRGRRRRRPLFFALALVIAACEGGPLGPTVAPLASDDNVGTRATFAVAAPAGLFGLDATAKTLGHIVRLPAGAIPSSPTLDQSRKALVFALLQTTEKEGLGSDIYSVNLDGSDLRPLVTHERPNVFYASPSLDRAADLLYVHRRSAEGDLRQAAVARTEDSIERIDLRTRERRTILADAAEPTLSPDGKSLLFVHLSRGDQDGLWTAAADGSSAGPFLKTRDSFVFQQAPRFSPNGRQVVVSAAGHLVNGGAPPSDHAGAAGGRSAHLGIQSEVFVAPVEGTALRSIATPSDDVVPAWSPEGGRIAFIVLGTFYVVAQADGAVQLSQRIPLLYGDPVWLR